MWGVDSEGAISYNSGNGIGFASGGGDHGSESGYICQDINECGDEHSCDVNQNMDSNGVYTGEARCINTPGSFACECIEPFSLDGVHGNASYDYMCGNFNVISTRQGHLQVDPTSGIDPSISSCTWLLAVPFQEEASSTLISLTFSQVDASSLPLVFSCTENFGIQNGVLHNSISDTSGGIGSGSIGTGSYSGTAAGYTGSYVLSGGELKWPVNLQNDFCIESYIVLNSVDGTGLAFELWDASGNQDSFGLDSAGARGDFSYCGDNWGWAAGWRKGEATATCAITADTADTCISSGTSDVVTGDTGTISVGSNYSTTVLYKPEKCTREWIIAVNSSQVGTISLQFTYFDTEAKYDTVTLYECTSADCSAPKLIAEFHGNDPNEYTANYPALSTKYLVDWFHEGGIQIGHIQHRVWISSYLESQHQLRPD